MHNLVRHNYYDTNVKAQRLDLNGGRLPVKEAGITMDHTFNEFDALRTG